MEQAQAKRDRKNAIRLANSKTYRTFPATNHPGFDHKAFIKKKMNKKILTN